MRHKKKFNHLGRQRGHRHAMLSNMAASLILHKRIKTTTAKAKALKMYIEPLITKAKDDTTHSRRLVFSLLQDKDATNEMFREVVVKVGDRPGGYTRIIKLGKRLGDNADMCIIELVDFNENMLADKAASKTSKRRRGTKKKTTSEKENADIAAAPVAEKAEAKTKAKVAEEEVVAKAETLEVKAEEVADAEIVEEVKAEDSEVEKESKDAPEKEEKKEE